MSDAINELKELVPWRRVITLERTPQRLVDFQERLKGVGIPPDTFAPLFGFDASTMKGELPTGRDGWFNRKGDFGCYASHLAAYQDMMQAEGAWALLVEDDCVFDPEFCDKLLDLIKNVPEDAHGIYLGGEHKRLPLRYDDRFYKVMGAQRTHCILYRITRVPEIYVKATRRSQSIDQILRRLHSELRFYCPHKHLAAQAAIKSTIGRSWTHDMWWHPVPYDDEKGIAMPAPETVTDLLSEPQKILGLVLNPDRYRRRLKGFKTSTRRSKILRGVDVQRVRGRTSEECPAPTWFDKTAPHYWVATQDHIAMMQQCLASDKDIFLIFEDDADVTKDFDEVLTKVALRLPANWKCVKLGGEERCGKGTQVDDRLYEAYGSLRMPAMLWSRHGLQHFYDWIFRHPIQVIDWMWKAWATKDWTGVYVVHPFICPERSDTKQRGQDS